MSALAIHNEQEARDALVGEAQESTVREKLLFKLTAPGAATEDFVEYVLNLEDAGTVLREVLGAVDRYSERMPVEVIDAYRNRWIDHLFAQDGWEAAERMYRLY